MPDVKEIQEVQSFYHEIASVHYRYLHYWSEHTFLHFAFFISVMLTMIPWVLWARMRTRNSTGRLLFAGFFVAIVCSFFDYWGTMYGLWFYTGKVAPLMTAYMPWDFSILPVFCMFLLQVGPKISGWVKALIFSSVSAFLGEPLFMRLGLYVQVNWSVLYSWPFYFVIYLAAYQLNRLRTFSEL